MSKQKRSLYPAKGSGTSIARERPRRVGRPRLIHSKSDPRYRPTPAELEEDISIPDASPHDVAQALFGRHPRRAR